MKTAIKRLLFIAFCFLLPILALAQEEKKYPDKNDLPADQLSYYYNNPTKILPDARTAFQNGDYARTLMLCSVHYVYYGDESGETAAKNKLKDNAEKCYDYTREMNALVEEGNIPEAKKRAEQLLKINPQDKNAQGVQKMKEPEPEPVVPITPPEPAKIAVTGVELTPKSKTLIVEETTTLEAKVSPADATDKDVIWSSSNPSVASVSQRGEITAKSAGTVTISVKTHDGGYTSAGTLTVKPKEEPVVTEPPVVVVTPPSPKKAARELNNTFFAQAGLGLYGGSIAPELALGMFNLGGSNIGLEIGVYGVLDGTGLFGADISPVGIIAKRFYLGPRLGFFHDGYGTNGLCAGAGIGILIRDHFLVSLNARYFPVIQYYGTKYVTTSGVTYEFPSVETSRHASVVPSISIGWAF